MQFARSGSGARSGAAFPAGAGGIQPGYASGGEVAAARAAGRAGTGYILSTISGHKLEDVKAGSEGPVFYQLYLMGGRGAAEAEH